LQVAWLAGGNRTTVGQEENVRTTVIAASFHGVRSIAAIDEFNIVPVAVSNSADFDVKEIHEIVETQRTSRSGRAEEGRSFGGARPVVVRTESVGEPIRGGRHA